MPHLKLLCDIGELDWIFSNSRDLASFLDKIVVMVANHMRADVCSIYLYDEETDSLTLTATKGLHSDSIGRVRLKSGEGLTGLAIKEQRPVVESVARLNPNYRHFEGIDEERFESFLAVPIVRGLAKIGVLVVQREKQVEFGKDEVMALQAVASQMANIVENTKHLMELSGGGIAGGLPGASPRQAPPTPRYAGDRVVAGRVASEGVALAPATVFEKKRSLESLGRLPLDGAYAIEDFAHAVERTEKELEDLQKQVEEKLSDVASLIFTAHLLILKDEGFVGAIYDRIGRGESPPAAILAVARQYIGMFAQSPHAYLREKVQDLEDLALRLIGQFLPATVPCTTCRDSIILARNLYPSDMLRLASENARGVVLVSGGITSHLSILARSLDIPMLIVDNPDLLGIEPGTRLLLDAESGQLFIDPTADVLRVYRARRREEGAPNETVGEIEAHRTRDGEPFRLLATINLRADLDRALRLGADGIGLYRSEFPFLIRNDFPSEEEQVHVYRQIAEGAPGRSATLRTLDIGGDKIVAYYPDTVEQNPFMGMRSIRFSLQHPDIFRKQLRAMLRAGRGVDLTVLFPMISSLDEFLDARDLLLHCAKELAAEGVEHNPAPKIGAMIEVPSILSVIDDIAAVADTFSIGTNDLIQYTLAVDRTNEKMAAHYLPHHPAVLRSIRAVVEAARRHGTRVSVCGDMAHQERFVPFFLGIGVRDLSVDPPFLPRIRRAMRQTDLAEARALATLLLDQNQVRETARILEQRFPPSAPRTPLPAVFAPPPTAQQTA